MKIQPIKIFTNSYCNKARQENNSVSTIAYNTNQNKQLSNNFYFPVNFTSSKKRTFSTDKKNLAEKSGDFVISKLSDIPCPACGKKNAQSNKI